MVATLRQLTPSAIARLDSVIFGHFCMLFSIACCFEPAVIYLCGWEGMQTQVCQQTLVGRIWHFYAATQECQQKLTGRLWLLVAGNFDPIYLNFQLWLRVVSTLDTILFGAFYAVSIYAFGSSAQESRWYSTIALPASGALMYSSFVEVIYESIAEARHASLLFVFLFKLPWTLTPVLLVLRLCLIREASSAAPVLLERSHSRAEALSPSDAASAAAAKVEARDAEELEAMEDEWSAKLGEHISRNAQLRVEIKQATRRAAHAERALIAANVKMAELQKATAEESKWSSTACDAHRRPPIAPPHTPPATPSRPLGGTPLTEHVTESTHEQHALRTKRVVTPTAIAW